MSHTPEPLIQTAIAQLEAMPERTYVTTNTGMHLNVDPEQAHTEADALLCTVLRSLDQNELVDAYEAAKRRVQFWYS